MFVCRADTASGLRLTVLAFLGMFALVHVDCTRYLLQTFIPKGLDSCTSYVQSTCTLSTKAAPQADTCSQQNAKQLAADVSSADNVQGVTIAFYGDSISKLWRDQNGRGMSQVYKSYFGEYSAAVLAVGGDQTANLWWRLQNGEIFTKHAPQLSVVLIGTNDLGAASCGVGEPGIKAAVGGVVSRIENIVSVLQEKNPSTTIILVGVLPRGDSKSGNVYPEPNKYTQSINDINGELQDYADKQDQVVFVDCKEQLLKDGQIHDSIMPDGLHPTKGMDRLADCLSPLIHKYAKK